MDVEAIAISRSRSRARRCLGRLIAATCLLVSAAPLCAQKPTEYDIKAAYLFNFGKFLRVPDEPAVSRRTSFDICVLGRNDFGGTLERLTANEQNNGLPERTVNVASAAEAKDCAILFLSSSEVDRVDGELADLAGAPVLTVSDMPRFLEHGGMIALEMQGNHVRFSVALDAVNRAGLMLSSELLKVASRVTGKPKGDLR
jgi:hypothetical protein